MPKEEYDPNLQRFSTAELYRMLALLDMAEGKGTGKISPQDLKTLELLMDAYNIGDAA